MSLSRAVLEAQAGLELSAQAREGSPEWFLRRGQALSLSFLRRAEQLQLSDPGGFERYYKAVSKQMKWIEDGTEQ